MKDRYLARRKLAVKNPDGEPLRLDVPSTAEVSILFNEHDQITYVNLSPGIKQLSLSPKMKSNLWKPVESHSPIFEVEQPVVQQRQEKLPSFKKKRNEVAADDLKLKMKMKYQEVMDKEYRIFRTVTPTLAQ